MYEDDCGDCWLTYCYDYVTHQVNSDFPCDGPTEMEVMPNDPMNPYWNSSCNTEPIYSGFFWDEFTCAEMPNIENCNFYPNSWDQNGEPGSENVVSLSTDSGIITSTLNLYSFSSALSINIQSDFTDKNKRKYC